MTINVAPSPMTEQEQRLIVKLWKRGYSAASIAVKLGTGRTRNSVTGWVDRNHQKYGLKRRNPHSVHQAPKEKKVKLAPAPVVPVVKPKVPKPVPLMAPLHELKALQCHYACNNPPKWQEHLFCGAPTPEGSPWCEYHKALVYVPMIVKSRRKRADILYLAGL